MALRRSSSLVRYMLRKAKIAAPATVSFHNQSPSCLLDGLAEPESAT
jgi:hypothetical protein